MAANDVTRAEFEALLTRVTRVEGIAVDVGDQFELFKETFTEMTNNVVMQGVQFSEYGEKLKKLEDIGIEASFAELMDKMKEDVREFERRVDDQGRCGGDPTDAAEDDEREGGARAAPARSDWCE